MLPNEARYLAHLDAFKAQYGTEAAAGFAAFIDHVDTRPHRPMFGPEAAPTSGVLAAYRTTYGPEAARAVFPLYQIGRDTVGTEALARITRAALAGTSILAARKAGRPAPVNTRRRFVRVRLDDLLLIQYQLDTHRREAADLAAATPSHLAAAALRRLAVRLDLAAANVRALLPPEER